MRRGRAQRGGPRRQRAERQTRKRAREETPRSLNARGRMADVAPRWPEGQPDATRAVGAVAEPGEWRMGGDDRRSD